MARFLTSIIKMKSDVNNANCYHTPYILSSHDVFPLPEKSPSRPAHLVKVSLHGLVLERRDGAHEVAHQHEVALGLEVQRHHVVEVATLQPQFVLGRPLEQTHLGR